MYFVYVLITSTGSYYIGQTNNIEKRLLRHSRGECRYTRNKLPVRLIYTESYNTRAEVMAREKYLKSLKNRKALTEIMSSDGGPFV